MIFKKLIPQNKSTQKRCIAINQAYFAVPDLRGVFLRGWDKDKKIDIGDRFFMYGQGLIKNTIGSLELDEILTHSHSYTTGFEDRSEKSNSND